MSAASTAPEDRYVQTRRKAFSGAKSLGVRHVLVGAISLGGSAFLIREVGPAAWASFGIAYLLTAFADQSLSTRVLGHLVRGEHEPDARDVASAATVMAVVGAAILIAFAGLSGPIGDLYGREDLSECLLAVGVCGFVYALRSTSTALLERSMDYRSIGIAEVLDQVTFYAVAIPAVATGAGITGIAWALALRGVLAAVFLRRRCPAPLIGRPDRERLRPILAFAGPAMATGLVLMVDGLVAPIVMGGARAVELGFYVTVCTIAGYGIAVAVVSQRISLPGLASLQTEPAKFVHGLERGLRLTMTATIATLAPLVATSPLWLSPLLGAQWEPAARVMIIASVGLVIGTYVHALAYSLTSLGHVRDTLFINVITTSSFAIAILALLPATTLLACPIGYVLSRVVGVPVVLWTMRRRGYPVRWRDQAGRVGFGVVAFAAVGLLVDAGRGASAALLAAAAAALWLTLSRSDFSALVRGLRGRH